MLDLSRVLAGPWSTQILGDLGAEVIKVEQPGAGDDTRAWGPPNLPDSSDSAYFSCANRNKRSIAIDIATAEGAELIRKLAAKSDVVVENFRVGGLAKYGLDYESLRAIKPDLVWCSITGFGQTGPDRDRGGYDFLIQGLSGLMSVTGAADGPPMKVGVPTSDLTTGLYAAISILAALRHRDATGEGQRIDLALLDAQLAMMSNQAANWLNGGREPRRLGNQHPNIVPYQVFACADGDILIATANDRQWGKLARALGLDDLADDPRFATMSGRSANKERAARHARTSDRGLGRSRPGRRTQPGRGAQRAGQHGARSIGGSASRGARHGPFDRTSRRQRSPVPWLPRAVLGHPGELPPRAAPHGRRHARGARQCSGPGQRRYRALD